ncbi:HetP family heterocyst commitment protein [Microcoleus sp. LEGE 07076]|uniref:HetP family heterocyst commitment protein n=1 Tax=Microcoleus sp. LEGE 07076 TaxID=915322 RepID=UPI00187F3F16|nr:HetP family heterocyst commitment protein [Microcoleus sp. LEGE 07076]MBE9184953.1 HetP family heterocyst commitment protein [Microcoleus sp. LEGE 07076]
MNSQFNHSANHSQVGIKPEQLDEIISAILAGKYSWACFLLLRCTGYNPLDYIPYRTSNRLLKENTQTRKSETQSALSKIADLDYVEVVREKRAGVRGGCATEVFSELHSDTVGVVPEVKPEGQNILASTVEVQNQGFFAGFKTRLFNLAGQ